jgi:hypothetical protein
MQTRPIQSVDRLVIVSILLGILSIAPLLVTISSMLLGNIFPMDLQRLGDFTGWLGSTRLVVYIGWLSLPGFLVGIIALTKGTTGIEKGIAIMGIILGLLGILWTYFISSMLRLADYW